MLSKWRGKRQRSKRVQRMKLVFKSRRSQDGLPRKGFSTSKQKSTGNGAGCLWNRNHFRLFKTGKEPEEKRSQTWERVTPSRERLSVVAIVEQFRLVTRIFWKFANKMDFQLWFRTAVVFQLLLIHGGIALPQGNYENNWKSDTFLMQLQTETIKVQHFWKRVRKSRKLVSPHEMQNTNKNEYYHANKSLFVFIDSIPMDSSAIDFGSEEDIPELPIGEYNRTDLGELCRSNKSLRKRITLRQYHLVGFRWEESADMEL